MTAFERRSFSFIQSATTGEEFFAHVSDYPNRTLFPVGTQVEFDLGSYRDKPKATRIRLIAPADPASNGGRHDNKR